MLQKSHGVALPVFGNAADFARQLHFPDFAAVADVKVSLAALAFALVASLETLLTVEAIGKLDPLIRKTQVNPELIA